jgi:hypothetical protein
MPHGAGLLRFEVLGALRAWQRGEQLSLGWPGQQAVLAALLLRDSYAVARDELIDAVWGPGSALILEGPRFPHLLSPPSRCWMTRTGSTAGHPDFGAESVLTSRRSVGPLPAETGAGARTNELDAGKRRPIIGSEEEPPAGGVG